MDTLTHTAAYRIGRRLAHPSQAAAILLDPESVAVMVESGGRHCLAVGGSALDFLA